MENKSKSLATVILSTSMMGLIVWGFSTPTIASFFNKNGFTFTSAKYLKETYLSPEKAIVKRQAKEILKKPKVYDSLNQSEKIAIDSLRSKVNFLENFTNSTDKLALSNFFTALTMSQDSALHIWYYGDSQIEGDRITQDLRILMQSTFGGSGLGYIPFSDVASYRTIELKPSSSWFKLNCFINKSPKGFGFAGKVFKLNTSDSNFKASTGIWISPQQKYQTLWLLHGKTSGAKMKITGKDTFSKNLNIAQTSIAGKMLLSSKPLYGNIQLQLPAGINYYGYLLEGAGGVQVDNCGIRGHSGDGLKYIEENTIKTQAKQLNTKLVIFHFGNNMIPYLKSREMDYFRKGFEETFLRFKKLIPNASFLVISPGDMGFVRNDQEISYPYIAELVETFRIAAKNTGCAFFDMHGMMLKSGGIKNWQRKGLANLDGHLSAAGQLLFAKSLFSEINKEMQVEKIINNIQ